MLYLLLTIVLNTILFAFFKVFPKYGVDNLQAIVANYFTCVITGCIFLGDVPIGAQSIEQEWLPWSMAQGIGFITIFNLIAWRTGKEGMTTVTVANKLSLVIPVIFAYYFYSEEINVGKIAGIFLAAPAVYLTTKTKDREEAKGGFGNHIFWIAILFVGSGLLDTGVKYAEQTFLKDDTAQMAYTIHVFATAAVAGSVVIIVLRLLGKIKLEAKNILAGIMLGVPNFFSLYYLIKMLNSGWMQSSAAIPVNNIGIVLLSAVIAILFFKEKAGMGRYIGLALSVIAILFIALSDLHGA